MAKYKRYDYDQMVMLPISLENQLSPGTLEFAIYYLVETRLDLTCFDEKYKNDETGRFAYDPEILLKIVLFAYSRGLIGSRRIEQACLENVIFGIGSAIGGVVAVIEAIVWIVTKRWSGQKIRTVV
jgi:transposase